MKAHLIDARLLVPRSKSSAKAKVKYQGNVSQKMGVSGALVFHKHILFFINFTGTARQQISHSALQEPSKCGMVTLSVLWWAIVGLMVKIWVIFLSAQS